MCVRESVCVREKGRESERGSVCEREREITITITSSQ